ncbi:MAG: glycosyltransferase [Candidatus Riflebacteria bacterium]|nr:glycosyltransferase [Candidatus Riflebacteria bacterium]
MIDLYKYKCIKDIGGWTLILNRIVDKITKSNRFDQMIYHICNNSKESEYARLLTDLFYIQTGSKLNLANPKTFNEKLQWLKLNDNSDLKTTLSDKYAVRSWISKKIGEQYLIPLLGVWSSFDKICFDNLPKSFVLKCNHGSGFNLIVKDKSKLDLNNTAQLFDKWLKTNYAYLYGLELQYKNIKPKIIAEQYIEQLDGNLLDYKIHCFNGEPKIIQVTGDRDFKTDKAKGCFFDLDWNKIDIPTNCDLFEKLPRRPDNIDEIISIAKKLGADFKYVRVDLYDISNRILFGEMTFTPYSGIEKWGRDGTVFSQLMGDVV